MPLPVTVVIPTLNEEGNLARCLGSLARQRGTGFGVIVVDGGSTDGTVDVARSFGAEVITLRERGIARARQAGFEAAPTEVIATTDADAVLPPHWVEAISAPFADPRVVGVYGATRHGGTKEWGAAVFRLWQRLHALWGLPIFLGPNFAVRKRAFLAVGGFREPGGSFPSGYPESDDFLIGLKLRRVGRVVFLPGLRVTVSGRRFRASSFPRELCLYARRYFQILRWDLAGELVPEEAHGRG